MPVETLVKPMQTIPPSGQAGGPKLRKGKSLFTAEMLIPSMIQAVKMLDPRMMVRNPVMFVAELGAALTTLATIAEMVSGGGSTVYFLHVSIWLWLTVWFANFAEAVAEARGRRKRLPCERRGRTSRRTASLTSIGRRRKTSPARSCATATSSW